MIRFKMITPNVGANTNEPVLYDMIMHYYTSHDVGQKEAAILTNKYIKEFKRIEGES